VPDAADLAAAVGQRIEQTPFRVVDLRPDGFTMHLDLADARWWGVLSRSGLRESYDYVVRTGPDGKYSSTERRRSVEWTAGTHGPVPSLGAELRGSTFHGKTWGVSSGTVVGVGDTGRVEPVVRYTFTPTSGRKIIADAATSLGMREEMSPSVKVGLVAAILGGAVAIGAVVLAVVTSASGAA
jgi:hypothetical protein